MNHAGADAYATCTAGVQNSGAEKRHRGCERGRVFFCSKIGRGGEEEYRTETWRRRRKRSDERAMTEVRRANKMTVQSIKMLNGAPGTITPVAVNQWGVSLINAGLGGGDGWWRM